MIPKNRNRFSEKIMLKQKIPVPLIRSYWIKVSGILRMPPAFAAPPEKT